VLAILTRGPGASNLRERLQREGVLPQHAIVASLTRHDQQLQAALEEAGAAALIFARSAAVSR
jgi:hypothetical protein